MIFETSRNFWISLNQPSATLVYAELLKPALTYVISFAERKDEKKLFIREKEKKMSRKISPSFSGIGFLTIAICIGQISLLHGNTERPI